jgi:non-heme chloroperoxidase
MDIADLHASYEGKLDARRDAITGTWRQIQTSPLNLQRATASAAIFNGARKYTKIEVPILALFESPPFLPDGMPPEVRAAANDQFAGQANRFEAGLPSAHVEPSAHVVRLANARHALWQTNEADVLREMNAFMAELK